MQSPASFSQIFGSSEVLTKNHGLLALHSVIRNLLTEPVSKALTICDLTNSCLQLRDPSSIARVYQRAEADVTILKKNCTELDVEYHFCSGETAKAHMELAFFKSTDFKSVEARQYEVKDRLVHSPPHLVYVVLVADLVRSRASTAETRLVRRVTTIHRGGSCVVPSDPVVSGVPIDSRRAGGVFKHLYFLCCDGVYRNALREPVSNTDPVNLPAGPAERELEALSSRLYYGLQMYESGGGPLPFHFSGTFSHLTYIVIPPCAEG